MGVCRYVLTLDPVQIDSNVSSLTHPSPMPTLSRPTIEAYVNPVVSTGRVGPGVPGVPGGCYETYVDGNSYAIGDLVSATVVTTSNPIYTMDPITGAWLTEIPTTETTRNYKCISNSWCGTSGYGPGSTGESLAWEEGIECSVSLTQLKRVAAYLL